MFKSFSVGPSDRALGRDRPAEEKISKAGYAAYPFSGSESPRMAVTVICSEQRMRSWSS